MSSVAPAALASLLIACTGPVKPGDSAPPTGQDSEVGGDPGAGGGPGIGGGPGGGPEPWEGADTGSGSDSGGGETDTAVPMAVTLVADNDKHYFPGTYYQDIAGSATIEEDGDLTGEIVYKTDRSGETLCDATISLSGTAASGACDNCDYAFAVDAEVADDRGDTTCELNPAWTFVIEPFDGYYINPHMGFASEYQLWGRYTYETYQDVWLTGIGVDYTVRGGEGVYPGPYWFAPIYDGEWHDRGWADLEGQELTWGFQLESDVFFSYHYQYCNTAASATPIEETWAASATGNVDCRSSYMDGWSFEAEAGDEVRLLVDAPDRNAYFEPAVFVNGPDGCAVVKATSNTSCISNPDKSELECASAQFVANQSGAYEVWIYATGLGCGDSTVEYSLSIKVIPYN